MNKNMITACFGGCMRSIKGLVEIKSVRMIRLGFLLCWGQARGGGGGILQV